MYATVYEDAKKRNDTALQQQIVKIFHDELSILLGGGSFRFFTWLT